MANRTPHPIRLEHPDRRTLQTVRLLLAIRGGYHCAPPMPMARGGWVLFAEPI